MPKKIKTILIVNDCLSNGGKERRLLELAKGLAKNNFYKVVIVILTDKVEYDYVYDLPIDFIILNRTYKFDLKTFKELKGVIKHYNPSIVHSWGALSSIYLAPLVRVFNIKFVNGIIADSCTLKNKRYYMSRLTFPISDVIISNTKAGIKAYKAPSNKSICIYNGLDLNRFNNLKNCFDLKKELFGQGSENYFVIGMVAAFEDRKDYSTLIKAAIALSDSNNLIRFLLVGGGSMWDLMNDLVPNHYKDKIIFTGKRKDIESIIQVFDVGILLTNSDKHGEGISNSIIEYMALSKPVIATRGGGTEEIIEDSVNGFLIDPFSTMQLINKISLLFNNKELADRLGQYGKKTIIEKFTIKKMTEKFEKLYEDLEANN